MREKKVMCGDCGKSFTTHQGLMRHQRTTCKFDEPKKEIQHNDKKCKCCGHPISEHSEHVGCMHYDKNDTRLRDGYCQCRLNKEELNKKSSEAKKNEN